MITLFGYIDRTSVGSINDAKQKVNRETSMSTVAATPNHLQRSPIESADEGPFFEEIFKEGVEWSDERMPTTTDTHTSEDIKVLFDEMLRPREEKVLVPSRMFLERHASIFSAFLTLILGTIVQFMTLFTSVAKSILMRGPFVMFGIVRAPTEKQ